MTIPPPPPGPPLPPGPGPTDPTPPPVPPPYPEPPDPQDPVVPPPTPRAALARAPVVSSKRFADRRAAGRALGERLVADRSPDVVVLGLPARRSDPRGGGGRPLWAPRSTSLVVRKLGLPWQPELAMGAIAAVGGTVETVRVESVLAAAHVPPDVFDEVRRARNSPNCAAARPPTAATVRRWSCAPGRWSSSTTGWPPGRRCARPWSPSGGRQPAQHHRRRPDRLTDRLRRPGAGRRRARLPERAAAPSAPSVRPTPTSAPPPTRRSGRPSPVAGPPQ